MEVENWTSSSEGSSDSEVHLQDLNDDDQWYTSGHIPKLQFRKNVSKAYWVEEMGMAEVVEKRGQMWKTMGVVRNGNVYCSIEEALFLVERGALLLFDDSDTPLSIKDTYEKVAVQRSGCCWESFEVYRHLKSLGYIVVRHGVPWTMKRTGFPSNSLDNAINGTRDEEREDGSSIAELLNKMQITEVKPIFDVYLPNGKFRKSSPGNPSFLLYLTRGHPPSRAEIEVLETQRNGTPLKLCHLEHGRVSFFSFNRVDLPVLP